MSQNNDPLIYREEGEIVVMFPLTSDGNHDIKK